MTHATHQSRKHRRQKHPKLQSLYSDLKTVAPSDGNSSKVQISPENYFHELLILERKRAERLKTTFAVMSIDVSGLYLQEKAVETIKCIFTSLRNTIRSTDIIGWNENGKSLGIIVTECNNKSIDLIRQKVSGKISEVVSGEHFSCIHFSHFIFPEIVPTGTAGAIVQNSILYNNHAVASNASGFSSGLKRLLDITGSLIGIVLFSPFFLIIPLLIKCTCGGRVFFRQVRVGKFGEHFTLLKFRTMHESNNDAIHRDFMRQFIKQVDVNNQNRTYKMTNDPRVTWIGKHLRKTSLDEIPQFFNILLGNMSLVGPRPAIPYEVDEYALWHRRRVLEVKPGLTGFWQVKGRSKTDFETMVRMDLAYIKKWSPGLDLKLILQTPLSLITAKGAY